MLNNKNNYGSTMPKEKKMSEKKVEPKKPMNSMKAKKVNTTMKENKPTKKVTF